jgi:hypothetical protein
MSQQRRYYYRKGQQIYMYNPGTIEYVETRMRRTRSRVVPLRGNGHHECRVRCFELWPVCNWLQPCGQMLELGRKEPPYSAYDWTENPENSMAMRN